VTCIAHASAIARTAAAIQKPLQRFVSVQQQQQRCAQLLVMLASAMMGQLQKHAQYLPELTSLDSLQWDITCRRDLKAGAQTDGQISFSCSLLGGFQLVFRQSILPIQDMILQAAVTAFSYASPSSKLETYLCKKYPFATF